MLEPRPEIRIASRKDWLALRTDGGPRPAELRLPSQSGDPAHSLMTTPFAPLRTSLITDAFSPRALSKSTAVWACSFGTIATIPIPQLNVLYISAELMRAVFC